LIPPGIIVLLLTGTGWARRRSVLETKRVHDTST
jgi:hypothetical protein